MKNQFERYQFTFEEYCAGIGTSPDMDYDYCYGISPKKAYREWKKDESEMSTDEIQTALATREFFNKIKATK